MPSCQAIHGQKADIMAIAGIFAAWISQADDKGELSVVQAGSRSVHWSVGKVIDR
jgi:hypothetical protein